MADKPKNLSLKVLEKQIIESNETHGKRMAGIEESMGKMLEILSAKKAPVVIQPSGKDSRDVYQHLDRIDIEFKENDDIHADVEVERPEITTIHSAEFVDKMDQHKFDLESVEIMVMPSAASYPDHTFTVGVNGKLRMITRGLKQWLPRCYVEVLLRAKISHYSNDEVVNKYNNEMTIKNNETKAHRYPLQIMTDRNPKGAAWLERVSNDVRA